MYFGMIFDCGVLSVGWGCFSMIDFGSDKYMINDFFKCFVDCFSVWFMS